MKRVIRASRNIEAKSTSQPNIHNTVKGIKQRIRQMLKKQSALCKEVSFGNPTSTYIPVVVEYTDGSKVKCTAWYDIDKYMKPATKSDMLPWDSNYSINRSTGEVFSSDGSRIGVAKIITDKYPTSKEANDYDLDSIRIDVGDVEIGHLTSPAAAHKILNKLKSRAVHSF